VTLSARAENAGHVADEHEWSWGSGWGCCRRPAKTSETYGRGLKRRWSLCHLHDDQPKPSNGLVSTGVHPEGGTLFDRAWVGHFSTGCEKAGQTSMSYIPVSRSGANDRARPANRPSCRATACQARALAPAAKDRSRRPPDPYSGTSAVIVTPESLGSAMASRSALIHWGSQPRPNPTDRSAEGSTSAASHAPTMHARRERAASTPRRAAAASIVPAKFNIRCRLWGCQDQHRPSSCQTSPPPVIATAAFQPPGCVRSRAPSRPSSVRLPSPPGTGRSRSAC
jgi:hypothetical protein